MDPAARAGTSGAEWIARPPHEKLRRKERPPLPSDDPFYQPPPGFQHALPGTVLRSATSSWPSRADTAAGHRHPAAVPDHRHERQAGGGGDHGDRPAEVAPGQPCPLLSYQCAIDAVASRCFPSYALRRYAKAIGALARWSFC
ncbi:putative triacylglycerol lipase domain protein [Mycobacterium xenopi 3993]|nr:putative triacylglycerol lipase domain protein [Mycobacterium xenopi 3993]